MRILLIVNIVVFFVALLPEFFGGNWLPVLFGLSESSWLDEAIIDYGVIPYFVLRGERLFTLVTSMFLHADILHLGGSRLILKIFGDNVEDAFGHVRFLVFYLVSGFAANAAFIGAQLLSSDPTALLVPAVGASGAIAGVLGAYIVMYPKARILTLVLIGWLVIVPLPAILFLGFWFVYQLILGMISFAIAETGIAYWAHIGGFVIGILFGLVWRGRRRIRTL